MSNSQPSPKTKDPGKAKGAANTIWVGVFNSWLDAVAAEERHNHKQNTKETGFASDRWLQRQFDILQDAKDGKWQRYSTLPMVAALIKPTVIVDFGGGSGWTYWALDEHTRAAVSKYVIIEIPESIPSYIANFSQGLVEYCTNSDFHGEFLHDDCLFYANSSLQYVQDDEIIRSIADDKKPRYILIDDMQVASRDFYSHERYYGQVITCRFSAMNGAVDLLSSEGYRLEGYWPYPKLYSGHLLPELECAASDSEIEIKTPMSALYARIDA